MGRATSVSSVVSFSPVRGDSQQARERSTLPTHLSEIALAPRTDIADALHAIRRGVSWAILSLVFSALYGTAHAQDTSWFDRVLTTKAEQPRWMTPLVTVTPRLE